MNAQPSRQHGKITRSLALVSVVLAVGATASPGCGNSGVVGGGCLEGLTNCSNHCVNLDTDQYNCGHCGHQCVSGIACIRGKCGGVDEVGGTGYGGEGGNGGHYRDGAAGGGTSSSDAQGDHIVEFDVGYPTGGGTNTGGTANGGNSGNGGNISGGAGGTGGDAGPVDACTPPYNDSLHCGDCFTVCPPELPVCAPAAGSYECRPFCEAPLVNCGGTCADLNSDSTNCGKCGVVCPSTVCQAGACVGVQVGDFVSICMNYKTPFGSSSPTPLVLGNSLFLPQVNPVRILAFTEYADPVTVQQVDATIQSAASRLFRQYSIVHSKSSTEIPTILNKSNFDVFLVYEQPNAAPGALSSIGDLWASSLEAFTYVGGDVVVLDGGQGVREMTQFITSSRMLPLSDEVVLSPPPTLSKVQLLDSVGRGIPTALPSQADTCVFDLSGTIDNASIIITEPQGDAGAGRPVVIHTARTAPQL